jgi:iron complex transport system permease protein
MRKTTFVVTALIIVLLLLMALGICLGSVKISLKDILSALFNPEATNNMVYIIRNLRLPRVLCAILAGAALSLGGLVFQSVFRNPMADSYLLGVSSGASCLIGFNILLGFGLSNVPAAFLGSVGATSLLFATNKGNQQKLLLSGIALNFLLSALTSLTIYLGKHQMDSVIYWTMGSLSASSWPRVYALAVAVLFSLLLLIKSTNAMDLLLMDDSTAISSGLNLRKTRLLLLFCASLLTALVVSFCGIIGFVGLMSPHFARLLMGPKHKRLIPVSTLLGSILLLLADILCRFLIAPSELPIGIITSILGAPVFLVLLRRNKNAF